MVRVKELIIAYLDSARDGHIVLRRLNGRDSRARLTCLCNAECHDRKPNDMIKSEITELITNKRARVGVIGLGYVGLPLAIEFGQAGF